MSRYTVKFNEPKNILGYDIDLLSYGLDHACGYFVYGELKGEPVFDRDSYGFGLAGDTAQIPLGNIELSEILKNIGRDVDAELVALDWPPEGK